MKGVQVAAVRAGGSWGGGDDLIGRECSLKGARVACVVFLTIKLPRKQTGKT